MLGIFDWLPAADPALFPTVVEGIQLIVALALPFGTYLVLQKPSVIRWKDILRVIGGIILPALLIIALQESIPISATALFIGIFLGHTVTMIDTD